MANNRKRGSYMSRFQDNWSVRYYERIQSLPDMYASATTSGLEYLEIGQLVTVDGQQYIYRGQTEDGIAILDPVTNTNVYP